MAVFNASAYPYLAARPAGTKQQVNFLGIGARFEMCFAWHKSSRHCADIFRNFGWLRSQPSARAECDMRDAMQIHQYALLVSSMMGRFARPLSATRLPRAATHNV
jgi:hypothetical protein